MIFINDTTIAFLNKAKQYTNDYQRLTKRAVREPDPQEQGLRRIVENYHRCICLVREPDPQEQGLRHGFSIAFIN